MRSQRHPTPQRFVPSGPRSVPRRPERRRRRSRPAARPRTRRREACVASPWVTLTVRLQKGPEGARDGGRWEDVGGRVSVGRCRPTETETYGKRCELFCPPRRMYPYGPLRPAARERHASRGVHRDRRAPHRLVADNPDTFPTLSTIADKGDGDRSTALCRPSRARAGRRSQVV